MDMAVRALSPLPLESTCRQGLHRTQLPARPQTRACCVQPQQLPGGTSRDGILCVPSVELRHICASPAWSHEPGVRAPPTEPHGGA